MLRTEAIKKTYAPEQKLNLLIIIRALKDLTYCSLRADPVLKKIEEQYTRADAEAFLTASHGIGRIYRDEIFHSAGIATCLIPKMIEWAKKDADAVSRIMTDLCY